MIKAESFGITEFGLNLPFPCEIHHCIPRAVPNPQNYRVLIHTGVPAQLRWTSNEVRKYWSNFDLILTSDKTLSDLPNAQFLIFGGCSEKNPPRKKTMSVSYLHRFDLNPDWEGHKLRQEIWNSRRALSASGLFDRWHSHRHPQGYADISEGDRALDQPESKIIFESMLSICIENKKEVDFFSEKIIDAFVSSTIPIYFGCPNIGEYFDLTGIIIFNTAADLERILSNLGPNDYWDRLAAINKNRLIALDYTDGFARVKNAILENYSKNQKKTIAAPRTPKSTLQFSDKNFSGSNEADPLAFSSSVGVVIMRGSRIDSQTTIGNYTYVGINVGITRSSIGNYCSIANNVNIGQGEHDISEISTSAVFYHNPWERLTVGDVIIGHDVWIGVGVTVLRGVKIGNGAVIGANAVVTRDVPPYAVAVGVPAKVIKFRFSPEKIKEILETQWWNQNPNEASLIFSRLLP